MKYLALLVVLASICLDPATAQSSSVGEPQTELGKQLKDSLEKILEHIKEQLEQGKAIREDILEKVKEIQEKLRELKVDIGQKLKELQQKIADKFKDWLKKITRDSKERRDVHDHLGELRELVRGKLDLEKLRELVRRLREALKEVGAELKDAILRKDYQRVREILRDLLHQHQAAQAADWWEQIKEHFKRAKNWLKDQFDMTLEKFRDLSGNQLKEVVDKFRESIKKFDLDSINQLWELFLKKKGDMELKDWNLLKKDIKDAKRELIIDEE